MVLVLIKEMVFPQQRKEGERQYLLDVERQPSISSGETSGFDDKTTTARGSSLMRCKIDPKIIADATIGLSDGLTVPFALTAGLSALGDARLVVDAGFAELVAGAISMGLGGYLAAKGEADGYFAALEETKECVENDKQRASDMVVSTFDKYNFSRETLDSMTTNLLADPESLVEFLMRFHHQLAEANYTQAKAYFCGITIALGYFIGGLIPLLPYLFFQHVSDALWCSCAVMAVALFVFGWVKTALVGETSLRKCFSNAVQMLVLGSLAAGAAMGLVRTIGG